MNMFQNNVLVATNKTKFQIKREMINFFLNILQVFAHSHVIDGLQ